MKTSMYFAVSQYLATGQDYEGFQALMDASEDIADERLTNVLTRADRAMYDGVEWREIRAGLRRDLSALLSPPL